MPRLYENFLENPPSYEELNARLEAMGAWSDICIVDAETPVKSRKQGSFIGLPDEHGGMPVLRCPSFFECLQMPDWLREMVVDPLQEHFGFKCNIVKVQKYINGNCGISKHTDKGIDLVQGEPIFFYRINKQSNKSRSIVFCDKGEDKAEERFAMNNNSLLKIEYVENQRTTHYVPLEEDEATDETISFVFRRSGTFVHPLTKQVYGTGARFLTYENRIACDLPARDIRVDKEAIVKLYNKENTVDLSELTYDDVYGELRAITV